MEIDVRPTADGDFVVFHDDRLDCKTERVGAVAETTMSELGTLDVGYGYVTARGEHPLRGKGVGMMRSLDQVLDAFPRGEFVVDVEFGDDPIAWRRLVAHLARRTRADRDRLVVVGADRGVAGLRAVLPEVRVGSRPLAIRCARNYVLLG